MFTFPETRKTSVLMRYKDISHFCSCYISVFSMWQQWSVYMVSMSVYGISVFCIARSSDKRPREADTFTRHTLPLTDTQARKRRIEYKLLHLAFKSVSNDGPSYLSDLLKFYIPSRQLRSSSDPRLRIPSFHLKSFGQRKFSYPQ